MTLEVKSDCFYVLSFYVISFTGKSRSKTFKSRNELVKELFCSKTETINFYIELF